MAFEALGRAWWFLVDHLVLLSMWTHFRSFNQNVLLPVESIITETDAGKAQGLITRWVRTRKVEVSYVQVAGAVVFTSVISCLSWTALEGRHWSGPALWYSSIVLAMLAVVLGAQQFLILENILPEDWEGVQKRMRVAVAGDWRPERSLLFMWQAPMMALSYSMVAFLGGLTSYIVSPVAQNRLWDGDAKTLAMFAVVLFITGLLFTVCSARIQAVLKKQLAFRSRIRFPV